MKNSIYKKLLGTILLFTVSSLSANEINQQNTRTHFEGLTYNYFYGKKDKVSVSVKRVIASDPQSSIHVLKILKNDKDSAVWLLAEENIKGLL